MNVKNAINLSTGSVNSQHIRKDIQVRRFMNEEHKKTFYNKSEVTVHQGTHTVDKPYKYEECKKEFYIK